MVQTWTPDPSKKKSRVAIDEASRRIKSNRGKYYYSPSESYKRMITKLGKTIPLTNLIVNEM